MSSKLRWILPALLAILLAGRSAVAGQKPVVIVFDFTSAYDGNRVGKFVAKNLLARLDRSQKCILVNRDDFIEAVSEAKFVAGFDDSPAKIVAFAAEKFGGTHAIWGKIAKVGAEGLKVFARAASAADKGKKLSVDTSIQVANQYEVQVATKEIRRLFFKTARVKPDVGPAEERRWLTAPNLVRNPGFERGTGHPAFWEPIGKSYHHGGVGWVPSPEGRGKCIRFTLSRAIAATYGVGYYSDPISITDGEIYRFSIRVRSDGPTIKIFLKHYRYFPAATDEAKGQWRETRRAPLNCKDENTRRGQWQTFTRDFRPHRADEHDPTITRIELYAYHPHGVVYFDDVVMKKLKDREAKKRK